MNATLESVQPDIFYKLASEPSLSAVTVFKVREQDIVSALDAALGGLGVIATAAVSNLPSSVCRPGTAMGATIEVMMPMIKTRESAGGPGPITILESRIRVQENHVINTSAVGTNLTAETIAQLILSILQLWGSQNSLALFAATEPVVVNRDFHPNITYDVVMNSLFVIAQLAGTATVGIVESAPLQLTLSCNTAGAVIYYTLDTSFPGSANATALIYAAPFLVPANTTVRAAAYGAGLSGSSVTATTVTA